MPDSVGQNRKQGILMIASTILRGVAALAVAAAAVPASAITINLVNVGGVEEGSNAYGGFKAAAKFWETYLTGNTTVTLEVGFGSLGAGILGSTGSTTNVAYVGDVLPALQAASTSSIDATAMANLPETRASAYIGGQALDAYISGPKANGNGVALPLNRVLDADAGANNSALSANTSLLKALGFTPTYTGAAATNQRDGSVTFSNAFNWDFNPTDGVTAGYYDFIGVAVHEIGHALGFRSGVDTYDGNVNFAGNLGDYALMSVWDIFRYSANSNGVNDWSIGTASYFSVDGGATAYEGGYFSTGRNYGDGRQASHWKDLNPPVGLMDPTVAGGFETFVTSLDLAAFDVMGWGTAIDVTTNKDFVFTSGDMWNLYNNPVVGVPEPATWAMLISGFGLVGLTARRRSRLAAKAAA